MIYFENERPNSNNAFKNWVQKEAMDKAHDKRIKEMVRMIYEAQNTPLLRHLNHKRMTKKLIMSLDDYDIRDLFVYYYYEFIELWIIEQVPEKAIYSIDTRKMFEKSIYIIDFNYNLDYIKEKVKQKNKEINMSNLTDEKVNERIEYLIGEIEYCKKTSFQRKKAMHKTVKNETPTDRLIVGLGGNTIVSKMLNITSEAVSRWKTHGIPTEKLDMIELKIIKDQL